MPHRHLLLFAAAMIIGATVFGAPERIEWDLRSATGGAAGGKPLKNSVITAEGLKAKGDDPRRDCGFKVTKGLVKPPTGPFRVTVGFIPSDAAFDPYHDYEMVLFDTMGVFQSRAVRKKLAPSELATGFQLNLRELGRNEYAVVANLGYAQAIVRVDGEPVTLPPGKRVTAALECDGLSTCRIYVNGKLNKTATISALPLSFGDKNVFIGGNYAHINCGFTGIVTDASIEYLPKKEFALAVVANRAFIRGQKGELQLEFRPGSAAEFKELKVSGEFAGIALPAVDIEPGKAFALPVETNLRPGRYRLTLNVSGLRNGESFSGKSEEILAIGPSPNDEMPVLLWNGRQLTDLRPFMKIGFNRTMFALTEHFPLEEQIKSSYENRYAALDRFVAAGMGVMDDLDIANPRLKDSMAKPNPIRGRDGKPRTGKKMIADPAAPQVVEIMKQVSFAGGKLYGNHPAVFGTLLNTERRDHMQPPLDATANARYKKATGCDIPPEVERKTARSYMSLKGIPASRIIPDDHPLLKYYTWYWRGGDGYHDLGAAMDEAFKQGAGRKDLVTMFDPAVRVPPIWGGGGRVDLIDQWVYAYPEPFRAATVAGEMRAMAGERKDQQVAIMTQMIVKRFELIPAGVKTFRTPEWFKRETKAPYMTTPPGLLREATWAMISRHVDYIMYHGSGALRPPLVGFEAYSCINLESEPVLSDVLNNVVKPLGPMLKRLPERPHDTAIYESFASCIFAGRGAWGWGREWPTGMLMYRANLAPATLYCDHVARGDLKDVKVLFMPHCDVLIASVAEEIRKFQARGGIVVADEHLAPGITPDIVIPEIVFQRYVGAKKFNAQYKQAAAQLLEKLRPHYRPFASADPEFLTFPRQYKNADYLFVVNDKRKYGGDFGVWRQVMEIGLPHSGKVSVARQSAAVYELSRGGSVKFASAKNQTSVKLDFKTNDGRLLLFLDSPIEGVELDAPESATVGEEFTLTATVRDASGKAVPALLPVELEITDPDGRKLDGLGYECAIDGVLKKSCRLALNDKPGTWKIRFTDRASGLTQSKKITVRER